MTFETNTLGWVLNRCDVFPRASASFALALASKVVSLERGSRTRLRCYVERKVGRAAGLPSSGGGTRRGRRITEKPVTESGAEEELRDVAQKPAKTTKFVPKWEHWSGRRRGIDTALKWVRSSREIYHL